MVHNPVSGTSILLLSCMITWTESVVPSFLQEPVDQVSVVGERYRVVFICRVTLRHLLVRDIGWWRNGIAIDAGVSDFRSYKNGTLVVTGRRTPGDKSADLYHCVADYGVMGVIRSRSAHLFPLDSSAIKWRWPEGQNVSVGSEALLPCHIKGSETFSDFVKVKSRWMKAGKQLDTKHERFMLWPNGDLLIRNVTHSDNAKYQCTFTMLAGSVNKTFPPASGRLSVMERESCMSCQIQPSLGLCDNGLLYYYSNSRDSACRQVPDGFCGNAADLYNNGEDCKQLCARAGICRLKTWCTVGSIVKTEGEPVSIYCMASAVPQPSITWQFNSHPALPEGFAVQEQGIYVAAVHRRHSGLYTCTARTPTEEQPCTVRLTVLSELSLAIQPEQLALAPGQSDIIKCSLTSMDDSSTLAFSWLRNGLPVNSSLADTREISTSYSSINVSYHKTGLFQCIVKDTHRWQRQKRLTVSVQKLPPPLQKLSVDQHAGHAVLRWALPDTQHVLKVYARLFGVQSDFRKLQLGDKEYRVDGLEPDTRYTFIVFTQNQFGDDGRRQNISFRTLDNPLKHPKSVQATAQNSTAIRLHWERQSGAKVKISGHVIRYKRAGGDDENWKYIEIRGASVSTLITGLKNFTRYVFVVYAFSDRRAGRRWESIGSSKVYAFTSWSDISVKVLNATAVRLRWDPYPQLDKVKHTKIVVKKVVDGRGKRIANAKTAQVTDYQADVFELQDNMAFRFRVLLLDRQKRRLSSSRSPLVTLPTRIPPPYFNISNYNSSHALVTWENCSTCPSVLFVEFRVTSGLTRVTHPWQKFDVTRRNGFLHWMSPGLQFTVEGRLKSLHTGYGNSGSIKYTHPEVVPPPLTPRCKRLSAVSVNCSWHPPAFSNQSVDGYSVTFRLQEEGEEWEALAAAVSKGRLWVVISGLIEGGAYQFGFVAHKGNMYSRRITSPTIVLDADSLVPRPQRVSATTENGNVIVQWHLPAKALHNYRLRAFEVHHALATERVPKFYKTSYSPTTTKIKLTQLKVSYPYLIRVRALYGELSLQNAVNGPIASDETVASVLNEPITIIPTEISCCPVDELLATLNVPAPRRLTARYGLQGPLTVTWYPPRHKDMEITGYKVHYLPVKPGSSLPISLTAWGLKLVQYPGRKLIISDLVGYNLTYAFRIRAYGDYGDGFLSDTVFAFVPPKTSSEAPTVTSLAPSTSPTPLAQVATSSTENSKVLLAVIVTVSVVFVVFAIASVVVFRRMLRKIPNVQKRSQAKLLSKPMPHQWLTSNQSGSNHQSQQTLPDSTGYGEKKHGRPSNSQLLKNNCGLNGIDTTTKTSSTDVAIASSSTNSMTINAQPNPATDIQAGSTAHVISQLQPATDIGQRKSTADITTKQTVPEVTSQNKASDVAQQNSTADLTIPETTIDIHQALTTMNSILACAANAVPDSKQAESAATNNLVASDNQSESGASNQIVGDTAV